MALQGTLDSFALPDVLKLLSSTQKTGRLIVNGPRGSGSLWMGTGDLVASEASGIPADTGHTEVVFELLRYAEGSFIFEADVTPTKKAVTANVAPVLADAERLLEEWREIEAVVPSLDAIVELAPELPQPDVVINAETWKTLVAVGSGCTVSHLADFLGLTEIPVCRSVKGLVESGLAQVVKAEDRPGLMDRGLSVVAHAEPEAVVVEESILVDEEPEVEDLETPFSSTPPWEEDVEDEAGDDLLEEEPWNESFAAESTGSKKGRFEPPPFRPDGTESAMAHDSLLVDDEDPDAEAMARQLAKLSPKAARAVAAAARANTDEEIEAALRTVEEESDEPVNRDLLLKFLGAVGN